MQARSRLLEPVRNGEGGAFAGGERARQVHRQRAGAPPKVQRPPAVVAHRADEEVDGVERHVADAVVDRAHRRRTDALHPLRGDVGREVEVDVLDLDGRVRAVLRLGAGERERPHDCVSQRKIASPSGRNPSHQVK